MLDGSVNANNDEAVVNNDHKNNNIFGRYVSEDSSFKNKKDTKPKDSVLEQSLAEYIRHLQKHTTLNTRHREYTIDKQILPGLEKIYLSVLFGSIAADEAMVNLSQEYDNNVDNKAADAAPQQSSVTATESSSEADQSVVVSSKDNNKSGVFRSIYPKTLAMIYVTHKRIQTDLEICMEEMDKRASDEANDLAHYNSQKALPTNSNDQLTDAVRYRKDQKDAAKLFLLRLKKRHSELMKAINLAESDSKLPNVNVECSTVLESSIASNSIMDTSLHQAMLVPLRPRPRFLHQFPSLYRPGTLCFGSPENDINNAATLIANTMKETIFQLLISLVKSSDTVRNNYAEGKRLYRIFLKNPLFFFKVVFKKIYFFGLCQFLFFFTFRRISFGSKWWKHQ